MFCKVIIKVNSNGVSRCPWGNTHLSASATSVGQCIHKLEKENISIFKCLFAQRYMFQQVPMMTQLPNESHLKI